jgi:hypothetical protein
MKQKSGPDKAQAEQVLKDRPCHANQLAVNETITAAEAGRFQWFLLP